MRYLIYFLGFIFISTASISCKEEDDGAANPRAENRKQLGLSASGLLSSDIYKSMTVELVFTPTSRPTPETISNITTFLTERTNKPDGITIVETLIDAPNGAPFTIEEIREIEDENRTQYSQENNIAVYIFFANGGSSNDTPTTLTLGTAYQNTSLVIYQETLVSLINANPEASLSRLESIVTEHEFGHLFGLVNIQDDDIHPKNHEDPDNGRHCVVEGCLMFFQSATLKSEINKMVRASSQKNIPVFDPLCIADLQAKGGK